MDHGKNLYPFALLWFYYLIVLPYLSPCSVIWLTGTDLTEIAVKRRIERIKAMVGSKEGAGTDATSSSPHPTPVKKANGVKNGFNPINKSKSGTSGANKNVECKI